MKKMFLFSAFIGMMIALLSFPSRAQVGVNEDNSAPDGTSMLDVKSTIRGMLIPRMTIAQRDAIASPAKGLMVFCTDNSQYYYNAGSPAAKNWVLMNTQWLNNGTSLYFNSGNVGIGLSNPSYLLDMKNAALGGTTGSTVPWLRIAGPVSNNDQLRILHNRTSDGTDWRTAEIRLQRTVDATDLHFISFRGTASGMGSLVFGFQGADQVTLKSNGNVGIGMTDPGQKLSVAGKLGLLETDATPVYYTVLQSGNISSQLTFTLPNGYGASGQVLATNGAGSMSWASAESPLAFLNGLTRVGSTVMWGGDLDVTTTITQPGAYGLNFINAGSANTVFNLTGTGDFDLQHGGTSSFYLTQDGKTGFGTTSPSSQVHITGNTGGETFSKVTYIENTSTTATAQQVWALEARVNHSTNVNAGAAVLGYSVNPAGSVAGIWGESAGEAGTGVYGRADHTTGVNRAVYGHTLSPNGYAGYFLGGRNYFEGKVGIGNSNPVYSIDVLGDLYLNYGTGYGNGMYVTGNTGLALAYVRNEYAGNTWGLSAGCSSNSAGSYSYGLYSYNNGTGYATYGTSSNGIGVYGRNSGSGNYGFLGNAYYGVQGQYGASGNYGYLGGYYFGVYGYHTESNNYGFLGSTNYGVFGNLYSGNQGDYAIFGHGVSSSGAIGTGYGVNTTLGGVKGYNYWGNPYTFAVAGFSYMDYNRSGATFGGYYNGSAPWGCIGYKDSWGSYYGGYFTSYTSGAGKSSGVMINAGIGAWGDLFGADIHGKVYGIYAEGGDYALFTNGNVFKNALDVHLQKEDNGQNAILYTSVSTEVTVQTCGFADLSAGYCRVAFDPAFSAIVSRSAPVIVTVTPMGNTGGVYLSEVTPEGFTAVENDNRKSSARVSYIAIGKRAGYENPVLPEAVVAGDYTEKIAAGLHNDADTQTNGQGLYYENGKLHVAVHPSTLPDPNKPAVDPDLQSGKQPVPPVERKAADRGDGRAPLNSH